MSSVDDKERFKLILEHAERLRSMGVVSVSLDGWGFSLLPGSVQAFEDSIEDGDMDEFVDALEDPHTYPGGSVPGLDLSRIRAKRRGEE